jgi:hypothetical protein
MKENISYLRTKMQIHDMCPTYQNQAQVTSIKLLLEKYVSSFPFVALE